MSAMIDLRISELLMSRLCHDLSGPIAAIGNGAELLDDDDPDFVRQAATLIGDSAGTAAKRLVLFRYVYGFGGGAIAGPPPQQLITGYFAGTQIACEYPAEARSLDPAWQRLGCNLLMIAGEGLPRGGKVALSAQGAAVAIAASGEGAGLSAELAGALTLKTPAAALTSRTVGAHFAGLLAEMLGHRVGIAAEPGGFHLSCEAGGS
ncbi:MAG TPA: histidine phosphotransferase family protein [Stellaceae bacterium]|nr:histidine phosphotransferase family protein [Stellaceae bacterium]